MQKILFYRDFRQFSGGHLKVWDYFQALKAHPQFEPQVFMPRGSKNPNNPWNENSLILERWEPNSADVLFLAGTDWLAVPSDFSPHKPIINLIQHPRHGWASNKLSQFLTRKAIRICVSKAVTNSLERSNLINGPMITIPNGIEIPNIQSFFPVTPCEVLIVGLKQPELGQYLYREILSQFSFPADQICLLIKPIPRKLFLSHLHQAKTTIFLPNPHEGFYLPALEGMALKTLVICPDCLGNQEYCLLDQTAIMPEYTIPGILAALSKSLKFSPRRRETMLQTALKKSSTLTLNQESEKFYQLLSQINTLW